MAAVCESLENLNVTRVAIAHRLSTIMQCDRIVDHRCHRINISVAHCGQRYGRPVYGVEESLKGIRFHIVNDKGRNKGVRNSQCSNCGENPFLFFENIGDDVKTLGVSQELKSAQYLEGS